jgi:hypothetical protein
LDELQFRAGRYWLNEEDGRQVPHEWYLQVHADIRRRDRRIIDRYGNFASAWEWFEATDALA